MRASDKGLGPRVAKIDVAFVTRGALDVASFMSLGGLSGTCHRPQFSSQRR